MSPSKDPAARQAAKPHRPPPASLPAFLSKLLPRNRPEQGGTSRAQADMGEHDSTYTGLGINPNELTHWNLPRETSRGTKALEAGIDARHRTPRNRSSHRRTSVHGDKKDVPHHPPSRPSADMARAHPAPSSNALESEPRATTRDKIIKALRAKEQRRKNRRDLIESGDWLGVQGADPNSGEFAVLTPTTTISTDATSPSAKKRLETLAREKKDAKLTYERLKMEEELEKERIAMGKDKSKLQKVQRAKEEARQKHDLPTWSKHRRRWSSAAEPDLSPIAQSPNSVNVGGNNSRNTAMAIRNFSRPSKTHELSGNSESAGQKPDHQQSSETVVRKPLPSQGSHELPVRPVEPFQSPDLPPVVDMPPPVDKSEKHFLWPRRRRMTDPGKLTKSHSLAVMNSSAGKSQDNLVSGSTGIPPLPRVPSPEERLDHFADLQIPDHHLHLAGLESMEKFELPPSNTRVVLPLRSILKTTTNSSQPPNPPRNPKPTPLAPGVATAISSQSKPTGTRKPRHVQRFSAPVRNPLSQTGTGKEAMTLPGVHVTATPARGHADLPAHAQVDPKLKPTKPHMSTDANHAATVTTGASAFTPTTTTTGSGPDRRNIPDKTQTCTYSLQQTMEHSTAIEETPVTLSSGNEKDQYAKPATITGNVQTSSQPSTPPRPSPSYELALETADHGTSSTGLAPLVTGTQMEAEAGPAADVPTASPSQTPLVSGQSVRNSLMDLVRKRLEEVGVSMPAVRQDQSPDEGRQETNGHVREGQIVEDQSSEPRLAKVRVRPAASQGRDWSRTIRDVPEQQLRHEETTLIQEAARIAMQRSRAREVYTMRDQSYSPRTPEAAMDGTVPLVPRTGLKRSKGVIQRENRAIEGHHVCDDVDIDSHSSEMDSPGRQYLSPQVDEEEGDKNGWTDEETEGFGVEESEKGTGRFRPDAVVAFASAFCITCVIVIQLGRMWWRAVRPVFDSRSAIWRRLREGAGTRRDLGVFVSAALFLVVVVGGMYTLTSAIIM
ncbi:hypothetical protein F5Y17DRAFT_48098 [Xylariaceae sp. FL0594]|nr:hypothetical protein F5Y17DRAFT_48098 [Xylariaceae sp. FL0594]